MLHHALSLKIFRWTEPVDPTRSCDPPENNIYQSDHPPSLSDLSASIKLRFKISKIRCIVLPSLPPSLPPCHVLQSGVVRCVTLTHSGWDLTHPHQPTTPVAFPRSHFISSWKNSGSLCSQSADLRFLRVYLFHWVGAEKCKSSSLRVSY